MTLSSKNSKLNKNAVLSFTSIGIAILLIFQNFPATAQKIDENIKEKVKFVSETAEFPEGQEAISTYFREHLKHPASVNKEDHEEGKAFVEWLVQEDGKVSNVKVFKSELSDVYNREIASVVEKMPQWKPAKDKDGHPTPAYFTTIVRFVKD